MPTPTPRPTGQGGGAPRQHPSSGHLAVADTWAPPRAAWLSPCRCWLSWGWMPTPGPATVPSAPWRPALCGTPRARATHICWSHVPTSDAAGGPRPMPPAALPPAQALCVAEATSPSQMVLVTSLGDRADAAPESRGQATAAGELGAAGGSTPSLPALQHHGGQSGHRGQGGHGDEGDTGDPRGCLSCPCSSLQLGAQTAWPLHPLPAGPCCLSPSCVP